MMCYNNQEGQTPLDLSLFLQPRTNGASLPYTKRLKREEHNYVPCCLPMEPIQH